LCASVSGDNILAAAQQRLMDRVLIRHQQDFEVGAIIKVVRAPIKERGDMALNNEPIRQRLHLLESYVRQLHTYRQRPLAEVLDDIGLAWAIEHGLQLSIQCTANTYLAFSRLDSNLTIPANTNKTADRGNS
jgi:hypothetical protein